MIQWQIEEAATSTRVSTHVALVYGVQYNDIVVYVGTFQNFRLEMTQVYEKCL